MDTKNSIQFSCNGINAMSQLVSFKIRPSKICGRQPLKNLKGYGLRKQNFFKGRLPQGLFGPFLNTLYSVRSEISLTCSLNYHLNQKIVAK